MRNLITVTKYYNEAVCNLFELDKNHAFYCINVIKDNYPESHSKYCIASTEHLQSKSEVRDYIKSIKNGYNHLSFDVKYNGLKSWEYLREQSCV